MPTIVILPGMHGTGELFAEFIAALPRAVESIVVSYPPDRPLNYAELEKLVRASLPVERPYVLLGESFSGPIAVSIAASKPAGLRGLMLVGSFVRNPTIVPERALSTDKPVPGLAGSGLAVCCFSARALRHASTPQSPGRRDCQG